MMASKGSLTPEIQKVMDNERGKLLLILALLSFLFNILTGLPAIIMGIKDLKRIRSGELSISQRKKIIAAIIISSYTTLSIPLGLLNLHYKNASFNAAFNKAAERFLQRQADSAIVLAQNYYNFETAAGKKRNTFKGFQLCNEGQGFYRLDHKILTASDDSLVIKFYTAAQAAMEIPKLEKGWSPQKNRLGKCAIINTARV